MVNCTKCARLYPDDALFCARCGGALGAEDLDEPARGPDLMGQTLQSRYLVESELGHGGMGTVYRAQDSRLGRSVALKVLAPHLVAHPTARRRMTQEAFAMARIEHANVVRLFDVFDEGPQLVIVMELVSGGDLTKVIVAGGVPVAEAVRLTEGILLGLQAIHAAGLVHRDIKPQNVLLSAGGVPKVTDLGVARDSQAAHKTQLGTRLGTPEYMSPEQAQGLAVDARSDLYAVGLVLFELLTGDLPFSGASEIELLAARLQQPPNLTLLAGKCGQALQQVVALSLSREAAQRYATADEMRQALLAAFDASGAEAGTAMLPPAASLDHLYDRFEQAERNSDDAAKQSIATHAPPAKFRTLSVVLVIALLAILGLAVTAGNSEAPVVTVAKESGGRVPFGQPINEVVGSQAEVASRSQEQVEKLTQEQGPALIADHPGEDTPAFNPEPKRKRKRKPEHQLKPTVEVESTPKPQLEPEI